MSFWMIVLAVVAFAAVVLFVVMRVVPACRLSCGLDSFWAAQKRRSRVVVTVYDDDMPCGVDALSDPDFVSGLDWRTLQDRETGRVRRNIRWERAGSRRRVEPTRIPVPSGSWDGVEARAAVRRVRHEAARVLAGLARAVNSGADPLDDEKM